MRAIAEVTINELKGRLGDRDRQLADLHRALEEAKLRWLAQHDTDRDEIQRLNQALFDRNNQSIENLKVWGSVWDRHNGGTATDRSLMISRCGERELRPKSSLC